MPLPAPAFKVKPLFQRSGFIQQVLEQREREDTFRLKRIKGKIEAREAEEEGGRPNPQVEIGAGL